MIRFFLRRCAFVGAVALMLVVPVGLALAATTVDVTILANPLDPTSDADGEWILFEHVSGDELDMGDWTLTDGAPSVFHTFSVASSTLSSGESLRVCANASSTENGGYDCDAEWIGGAVLNNDGDTVTIKDSEGNFVAEYSWESTVDGVVATSSFVFDDSLLDFGDAPDEPYPTLLENDGARHILEGELYLGTFVDEEEDGQPTSDADGDDTSGEDDESGIAFLTPIIPAEVASIDVESSGEGLLDAWIDFNDDGDWDDAGEQIFTSESVSTGTTTLEFTVPFFATITEETYARFRLSSEGGLAPTGLASDGEVEDYVVEIEDRLTPFIYGYKWNDMDGDGFWDEESEPTLKNWSIVVHDTTGEPLEELLLASDDPDGEQLTVKLKKNKWYIIEVEGTWQNGNNRRVDAEYYSDDNWSSHDDLENDDTRDPRQLDIVMNDQNVDWGEYNDEHIYKILVKGTGDKPTFRVFDEDNDANPPAWYANNDGLITVRVFAVNDEITKTDKDGLYTQAVSASTTYQIFEVLKDEWVQTAPQDPHYFTEEIEDDTDLYGPFNFGNYTWGFIQGFKYHDVNEDGRFRNRDDFRLTDWTIRLYDDEWELLDEKITGHIGNAEKGRYRFDGLGMGDYYVCEAADEEWFQTEPLGGDGDGDGVPSFHEEDAPYCYSVSLDYYGHEVTGKRFGNTPECQVYGFKYDAEGTPLPNWTIGVAPYYEEDDIGTTTQSTLTDENGFYCLNDVGVEGEPEHEDYIVYEELQHGWDFVKVEVDGEESFYATDDVFDVFVGVDINDEDDRIRVDFYNELIPAPEACLIDEDLSPVVLDRFDDEDTEEGLGTADTGQAWEDLDRTVWGIDNGEAYKVTGGNNHPHTVIDSGVSDGAVEVVIADHDDINRGYGVTFRMVDSANYWRLITDTNDRWHIQKIVTGVADGTKIGTPFTTFHEKKDGNVVRIVFIEDTITLFIDGVFKGTFQDGFAQEGTKHGLRVRHVDEDTRFDNFVVSSTPEVCPLGALNEYDFGDAPDRSVGGNRYPTKLADDGARHLLQGGFFLGNEVDVDEDGRPHDAAIGDDAFDTGDDEDGLATTTLTVVGTTGSLELTASADGLLDAWVDFNTDGDWDDEGEQIFASEPLVGGGNILEFTAPSDLPESFVTFIRLRFSSEGGLAPTGAADDGEVEDHRITINVSPEEIPDDGGDEGGEGEGESESFTGGGTTSRVSGGGNSGGEVAGAAIDLSNAAAESCGDGLYLKEYLRFGSDNDSWEVQKLQMFLNVWVDAGLVVNGVFDVATFEAVKAFQLLYSADILAPWGISEPTGYVYITTRRFINMEVCSELDIPLPENLR